MKRILILLLILCAANAWALSPSFLQVATSGGSTQTCTQGPNVATANDYRIIGGHTSISQGINSPGSAKQLCAVSVRLRLNDVSESYHAELWTTPDFSGSKIGSNSNSFNVSDDDNAGTDYTITWTTYPTVSSQYYLHLIPSSWASTQVTWASNTAETSYGAGMAGDNANRDGSDLGDDYVFSVSYLQ